MDPVVPKPGLKTTEFWVVLISLILGAVLEIAGTQAEGLVNVIAVITGGALQILAALGYLAARTTVKVAARPVLLAEPLLPEELVDEDGEPLVE